jgi:hypothetical protein
MTTEIKKRNTQLNKIRAKSKKDSSPNWEGQELWSAKQFMDYFRDSLRYYSLESSAKDLKIKVLEWMEFKSFSKEDIKRFKDSDDWRCSSTMGAIAANLLRGMPELRPDFNNGKNTADWLKKEIERVIKIQHDNIKVVEEKQAVAPPINVQERIREQASQMSEVIDSAIDQFITDPNKFDPNSYKIINVFRERGVKAAQARIIKTFYERGQNELLELASGNADDQLREAYKHHPRKNVKKLIDFYEKLMSACDQIIAESKILKKPRKKKLKSADELVKKLKLCIKDDKLGIVSIPPANLIGAQFAVVYNVKTRKIGLYKSMSINGFEVKGSSLVGFNDQSSQKTLRNPAIQIKEFKEQTTQKKIESWYSKSVKTTETSLNGRFSEDTILLKVIK